MQMLSEKNSKESTVSTYFREIEKIQTMVNTAPMWLYFVS